MPCILIHVLNNSLSVFLSLRYPEAESLTEVLGVEWPWGGIVVSLLVLAVSLRLLWKYNYRTDWKRSEVWKRRLNILCVVVLLVLGWSVGKSLYYMYIAIEVGVEKGLEMARNADSTEDRSAARTLRR